MKLESINKNGVEINECNIIGFSNLHLFKQINIDLILWVAYRIVYINYYALLYLAEQIFPASRRIVYFFFYCFTSYIIRSIFLVIELRLSRNIRGRGIHRISSFYYLKLTIISMVMLD